jgi:glycosyltransferase involved in cell wall biosynthesis
MRILNIVENLNKGSVENWLVNAFLESRCSHPHLEWTFYCVLAEPGCLDATVREAGGTIIYSPTPLSNKFSFLHSLRAILKKGKFDIIHSHHDYLSAFYFLASVGIRTKRIVHVHNTDRSLPTTNLVLKKLLLRIFRWIVLTYSDVVVGVSSIALSDFFCENSKRKIGKVLYCGIDANKFKAQAGVSLRDELNISPEAKVLLFVGRMNELKNPLFIIEVLRIVLQTRDDVCALFVGEGHLEEVVRAKASLLNIENHIRLLRWRQDIATIMKQSDVFVFPRLEQPKEALGLVLIEAQAAGLPMIVSNAVVEDAIVVKEIVKQLSVEDAAEDWAKEVLSILENSSFSKEQALNKIENSPFNIHASAKNLVHLYDDCYER